MFLVWKGREEWKWFSSQNLLLSDSALSSLGFDVGTNTYNRNSFFFSKRKNQEKNKNVIVLPV